MLKTMVAMMENHSDGNVVLSATVPVTVFYSVHINIYAVQLCIDSLV